MSEELYECSHRGGVLCVHTLDVGLKVHVRAQSPCAECVTSPSGLQNLKEHMRAKCTNILLYLLIAKCVISFVLVMGLKISHHRGVLCVYAGQILSHF